MALAALPDEISRHIEAALVLSKRDVLLRVLHEAELCVRSEQLATAAILAAVVLDEVFPLLGTRALDEEEDNVTTWREMRNRAVHHGPVDLRSEEVKAMIGGIRALLDQTERSSARSRSLPPNHDALTRTRGKYAFVETSVDGFLKRKHEDLELEERK